MQKVSQLVLCGSLASFLMAGTIRFWPEIGSLPAYPPLVQSKFWWQSDPRFAARPGNEQAAMAQGYGMPPAFAWGGAAGAYPVPGSPRTSGPRVSLQESGIPVRRALNRLFQQAGVAYSLNGVLDEAINIHIQDVPLEQALGQISAAAAVVRQPFFWRLEQGIYIVRPIAVGADAPVSLLPTRNGGMRSE